MGVASQNIHLAPLVYYDDYDKRGLVLAIKQGLVIELNEPETVILSAMLSASPTEKDGITEKEGIALLERLRDQHLIVSHTSSSSRNPHPVTPSPERRPHPRAIHSQQRSFLQERLVGAEHIIFVLNELRQEQGLHKAYQYLQNLEQKNTKAVLPKKEAFQRANDDYWFYRLVTGIFERKVSHLLGHLPGDEGFCLVKAFALCAYLLSLDIFAQVIIARPKYGARSKYRLHAWVEIQGEPVNEHSNIHDGFRTMCMFPSHSDIC